MKTYAAEFFRNALKVAEAFPDQYGDFCREAAERSVWGADPVEIAQKSIVRAEARNFYDPLSQPVTEDGHPTIRGILGKRGIR